MTPGDLLALVIDNYRQASQRATERQIARVEAYDRDIALRQDIIVRLQQIPNRLVINHDLQLQVRRVLKQRQLEVSKRHQQVLELEQDVERLLGELRELVGQRERRLLQLWQAHVQQPAYAEQMRQGQVLSRELEQLRIALPRLADECNRKMPDYDRNPYYVYLRTRRYGTDDYRRSGLFRALDDWLANKVDYRDNRRNELILRSMPDRVADMLGEHTEALRAMERNNVASWATATQALHNDPGALRRTLLAKQFLAAEQRAFEAYQGLEMIARREDDWTRDIWDNLDAQLNGNQLNLEDCLEILMSEQPRHRAELEKMWQALVTQQRQLDERFDNAEQALAEHNHALELLFALLQLRRNEPPAIEQTQCDCRHGEQNRGLCMCTFDDLRCYDYPASLDIPGLIAGYMKKNLALHDVMELLHSQRQAFDQRAADPTATNNALPVL